MASLRLEPVPLLIRTAAFFGLWVIVAGVEPADLAAGLIAAALAAGISLRLLPPLPGRLRFLPLIRLAVRFLGQSIFAGIDVAWRALQPSLPLRPGFVTYRSRFPEGRAQDAFCTITSLLPGTLPSGTDDAGRLIIHCLDTRQPIVEQLAQE